MSDDYDEDYFLRGKQTGKSLYEDYRWLPELTVPMAEAIVLHCGITRKHNILDFGCARGYTVKALRMLEYSAFGTDVSRWAIANADEGVRKYCYMSGACPSHVWSSIDWIVAKDVLEHCEYVESVINDLMLSANVGLFIVVPLSKFKGGTYVIGDYDRDVTHKQRMPLGDWVRMFLRPGWSVQASYRVRGVKDNYYKPGWEFGNGFITARRME